MTDGQGQVVDFKNTIIIMTSNIGADLIKQGLQNNEKTSSIESKLMVEITKHFRPEFLNRFDAKVMFNALRAEDVIKIADIELHKLAEKLLYENSLELAWHKNIPAVITQSAYNLVDGARPIKRFINDTIIGLITEQLLDGNVVKGDTLYIPWKTSNKIKLTNVTYEELQTFKEREKNDPDLIVKPSVGKLSETKKSKKTKKNEMDITIDLKTELGD
jgi:ATP-dependent Clp protease ATP-binding subunit ClpB